MKELLQKILLLLLPLLFLTTGCEKISEGGPKGYWMSDRSFYNCKKVYYFDGKGGGVLYDALSTNSTYWNRDCDCHRFNTEYVGAFDGAKYYRSKDNVPDALIYTLVGSSLVISYSNGEEVTYLSYNDGYLEGYHKVTKH